jgi:CRP-like cAMP-binding protein
LVTKKLLEEPPIPNKKIVKKPSDKSPGIKGDAEGRKSKSMNKVANALGGIGGLLGKGKGLASMLQRSSTVGNNGQPRQEPGSASKN